MPVILSTETEARKEEITVPIWFGTFDDIRTALTCLVAEAVTGPSHVPESYQLWRLQQASCSRAPRQMP